MNPDRKALDLTTGTIWKALLLYFFPILAGALFQQLYATADAVILGKFAGKEGLAAIDSIYNLLKLPVNFFSGLSAGAAIIISQCFGEKEQNNLSKAVHTAVLFSFIGGLLLSVVCVTAAPLGLKLMEVPEEIFPLALGYVRIYFGGLIVSMIYNICAGILRAVGDSQTPFWILAVSGAVNVGLDLLFVAALGWSAPGAALATVLAQTVSAGAAMAVLIRRRASYQVVLRQLRFDRPVLKKIFSLGLPMAMQSILYPISNMTVQAAVNQTGTDNIVAWALCGKLDFLIWLAVDSFGAAIATFVAQNYGARQYHRCRKGVRIGLGMALAMVILISGVLFLWSEPLGRLILRPADAPIATITERLMHMMAPLYFLYVFGEIYAGAIRGEGESLRPMVITLLGTCATRILWIWFVPHHNRLLAILAVYPVSWAVTSLAFVIYYHLFRTRRTKADYDVFD